MIEGGHKWMVSILVTAMGPQWTVEVDALW